MHKYIILLLILFSVLTSIAENASNIRVRQEGKAIVVTYDLNKSSVVRLLMASGKSNQYTELKAVSGNVGKNVSAGQNRKIVWKPLEEKEAFIAENVRFKVEAMSSYDYRAQNATMKTLVLGQVGYSVAPQLSYGAMIGQMYKGIGWYVSGRSNFQFNTPAELACNEQGYIDSERPFYTGNISTTHYIINAGFMMNVLEKTTKNKFNTLGFYLGGGYGKRELQWETTDGLWVKYAPTSHTGFSGNIGLFGSVYGITLSAGVNTINFKHVEIEAGIGYMF
jgi:hypothetical protein